MLRVRGTLSIGKLSHVLAMLAIAIIIYSSVADRVKSATLFGNFRAFYCAGRVANDGGDSFEAEPLGRCEHSLQPAGLFQGLSAPVIPAPVPGYLLGLFQLFARIPFWLASAVWCIVLIAAMVCAIAVFSRLNVASPVAFTLASAMAVFGASITDGEPIPIALLGIALVAFGAAQERTSAVAFGFVLTMVEPQIGAVLALALAVMRPRWFTVVAVASFGLLIVSLAVSGFAHNVAYLTTYLPLHVASEVHMMLQYSPTWMAGALGLPDSTSLAIGRISYMLSALIALGLAWHGRANKDRALLVCTIPVIALCGSSYLHPEHIGLALPAALAIASGKNRETTAARGFAACLVASLLIAPKDPWLVWLVPFVAALLIGLLGGSGRQSLGSGIIAAAMLFLIAIAITAFGLAQHALPPLPVHTPELASESWNNYVRAHGSTASWTIWLVKLPTWIGLYGTALLCCRQLASEVPIERAALSTVV